MSGNEELEALDRIALHHSESHRISKERMERYDADGCSRRYHAGWEDACFFFHEQIVALKDERERLLQVHQA